ncbi:SAM-dependent methyltransferase [Thermomonospora amylolytica]|uniref:SAM-dependent methyltransferase n=1 Tax=Thermomonospora amylolytica TaxID=1411117 RepID=UPI000E6C0BD3|nr:methyltransferase domain-containing protein [Thermomonospora amylolytica]
MEARSDERLRERLVMPRFPRSGTYDPRWMIANVMGPNPLWLLEELTGRMELRPGMRVLDLGCGKAMTSVFLAREFGVDVWAADLWIPPTDNLERIREAGCADRVVPLRAEARELPFAHGYFDAVVSVDAYHYFGTDDFYLGYLADFIRPGGTLGIAVPGVRAEIERVPEHLRPYWQWEFMSLHTVAWWRRHWELTGRARVRDAWEPDDGWRLWRTWCEVCAEAAEDEAVREASRREALMLDADAGRTFTFAHLVAEMTEPAGS